MGIQSMIVAQCPVCKLREEYEQSKYHQSVSRDRTTFIIGVRIGASQRLRFEATAIHKDCVPKVEALCREISEQVRALLQEDDLVMGQDD